MKIHTIDYKKHFGNTKSLKKGINYTKLTGIREFGKFLMKKGMYDKRMFLNRNTIIEVL